MPSVFLKRLFDGWPKAVEEARKHPDSSADWHQADAEQNPHLYDGAGNAWTSELVQQLRRKEAMLQELAAALTPSSPREAAELAPLRASVMAAIAAEIPRLLSMSLLGFTDQEEGPVATLRDTLMDLLRVEIATLIETALKTRKRNG